MKFVFGLLLCTITALSVCAETKQELGRKIIDQAVVALGGENFLRVSDRVENGRAYSFYRERLTGLAKAKIYTQYVKPSEKKLGQRERQAFGKDEDVVTLFTEDAGYQITFRGAKPLESARHSRYMDSTRRNIFYILRQRLNEPGLIFEHQQSTIWSNVPVEVVSITDANNETVTVYFQKSTNLPVRQVFYRRNPVDKERDEEVSIYSKYRDIGGGIHWPFNIMSERNGEKVFELYSDSVTVNQDLSSELFNLPGKMKVLRPDPAE